MPLLDTFARLILVPLRFLLWSLRDLFGVNLFEEPPPAVDERSAELRRLERAQRDIDAQIRREQEFEYEQSLAADRAKAEEKRNKEAAERLEQTRQEDEARKEKLRLERLLDKKRIVGESLPSEPLANASDVVRIAVRFPNGSKFECRFQPDDSLENLFNATFAQPQCPNDFSIISNYPRKELKCAPAWFQEFSPTAGNGDSVTQTFREAGLEGSVGVLVRDNEA